MKKLNALTSGLLIATLGLTACGGDDSSDSQEITHNNEVKNLSVNGVVSDSAGNPIPGVTIHTADKTVTTDASGKYMLELADIESDNSSVVILIKKDGYMTTAKEINAVANGTYNVDVILSADQVTSEFYSNNGINQLQVSGATVTIPSNSIVTADGKEYIGKVNIASNYYNPDSVAGAQAFAQPFAGQDEDGSNETGLVTVGVIDVKLTDPTTGAKLDLKEGSKATLTFPEASTDQDLTQIPLWYYDEEKMIWVKDGTATRQSDGTYKGEVSHFTLWNLDIAVLDYSALVQGCFVEENTQKPIAGGIDAMIKGRGFVNYGGIDSEGKFSARVPINTPLTLAPHYNANSFDAVQIPALEQNAIYTINDGDCITAKDPSSDDIFTYVDVFEVLPPEPVIVTPNPQPKPPVDPITPPATETEAGLIGYSFYFDEDYINSSYQLNDVELETIRATANNTMEIIDQSLYNKSNYNNNQPSDSSVYALTVNGLEPIYNFSLINNDKFLKIEWINTVFSNNTISQQLQNGVAYEVKMQEVSIANQKIGDVLSLENIDDLNEQESYLDIPLQVIEDLNSLPNQLSIFGANASCKKLVSISHGPMDYIEFDIDFPMDQINFENPYFDSPISGTWAGIPWIASSDKDEYESDTSDAYVKYDDKTYSAEYYWPGEENLTDTEKNECIIYNEAAKEQIIAALQEAYPAL